MITEYLYNATQPTKTERGPGYGETKEGIREEAYSAEYQHGSGAVGTGDEVLPAAGPGDIVGDSTSPGPVSGQA